ncbi:hypothetical protein [Bradyrhizobium sp. UNPA324]|uniref:hypothetical protein n=1 Tax=Bradyrhizobium sp. UNPA324 TaxID=1141174 RepID=UPI001FEE4719|nr:hypothetical protein [Bradyrhizobium sp. UNPA324]
MAAAANRDLEAELGRKRDGINDIGHAAAPGNQCRPFVDQPIVDPSRLLITLVGWLEELSSEGSAKIGGSAGDRCDRRHDMVSSA